MVLVEERSRRFTLLGAHILQKIVFDEDIEKCLDSYVKTRNSDYFILSSRRAQRYNIVEFFKFLIENLYDELKEEEHIDLELLEELDRIRFSESEYFTPSICRMRILEYDEFCKFYTKDEEEYYIDYKGERIYL